MSCSLCSYLQHRLRYGPNQHICFTGDGVTTLIAWSATQTADAALRSGSICLFLSISAAVICCGIATFIFGRIRVPNWTGRSIRSHPAKLKQYGIGLCLGVQFGTWLFWVRLHERHAARCVPAVRSEHATAWKRRRARPAILQEKCAPHVCPCVCVCTCVRVCVAILLHAVSGNETRAAMHADLAQVALLLLMDASRFAARVNAAPHMMGEEPIMPPTVFRAPSNLIMSVNHRNG